MGHRNQCSIRIKKYGWLSVRHHNTNSILNYKKAMNDNYVWFFYFYVQPKPISIHMATWSERSWAGLSSSVLFQRLAASDWRTFLCRSVLGTMTIKAGGYILDVGGIILFCCMIIYLGWIWTNIMKHINLLVHMPTCLEMNSLVVATFSSIFQALNHTRISVSTPPTLCSFVQQHQLTN